jgi:RNA polymerase sigma-B factor
VGDLETVFARHGGQQAGAGVRMDERALLRRWHNDRDTAARDALVERMLPLARRVASRYRRVGEPLDDLVQIAVIGLVKAIDRFDPARDTALSSYAVPTMLGELKRHFRDHGWALHVPRGLQERVFRVDEAERTLARSLGRTPTTGEVAAATGLSAEEVLEAHEAAGALESVSLEEQRFGTGGTEGEATYADGVGEVDENFDRVEYMAVLANAVRALPERDRLVLQLRFREDLTQSQIAERLGISQMHVSRLLRRSLERLRAAAGEAG